MKLIDNSLKSFQVKGRLPQWAYWLIGVIVFASGWYGVGRWARWVALNDLASNQDHWSADGVLEQDTDYTCVPASIVMLLKDKGIDTTTYDVAVVAGTDIFGTDGSGIIEAARHFGLHARREMMTFDDFMSAGLPGILEFRYKGTKHAAYILPVPQLDMMQMKDPVDGLLYFDKPTAAEHFGSDRWEVYLFE
jgi:hypothetical protein